VTPLLNYDNVKATILLPNDKDAFNLGQWRLRAPLAGKVKSGCKPVASSCIAALQQ